MDNTEKLATQGTQDEENQSKNTAEYVLDITIRKPTKVTEIRHAHSNKQLVLICIRHKGMLGLKNTSILA